MASTTSQWWKRLRCDCFSDDIVRDDHEEFTELLIPNKNDVSNVTDSTADESEVWDEDDILVHDPMTNHTLPQQQQQQQQQQQHERSFLLGMLAPNTTGVAGGNMGGIMDLVDMAKAKFMSSSEINYPPSQTGSSLVDYPSKIELPSGTTSWAKMAANLRARRNKTTASTWNNHNNPSPPAASTTTTTTGNTVQHPTGHCLLGIAFPHPAYMHGNNTTKNAPTPPHKARYFKTSSNVHHPHKEHQVVMTATRIVSKEEEEDEKVIVRL